jgi:hypothetical protein
MNVILTKLGMSIIAITGEETYKIYSKKVFNEDRTMDTDVDRLYDDIVVDKFEQGEQK